MPTVVIGLNHKSSPLQMRESMGFCMQGLKGALQELKDSPEIHEVCILSTCNRTEFYVSCDSAQDCEKAVARFTLKKGVDYYKQKDNFYMHSGRAAIEHLFCVAAGLDAMVVGEAQILGQVRNAILLARSARTSGPEINRLFEEAVLVAGRVHSETRITEGEVSVASLAVDRAREFFGNFKERAAMIIGAGEMSELTAKCLSHKGIKTILVANRSMKKAMKIAHSLGAQAVSWNEFTEQIKNVDILISSTSAPHPLIKASIIEQVMLERKGRQLFIVDLAVPRDVEQAVADIPGVHLANIDDLDHIAQENLKLRQEYLAPAQNIIKEEAQSYL